MRVYFARSVAAYSTPQDERDLALIRYLGWEVVDPNGPVHEVGYRRFGMDYFKAMIESCQGICFRAHPDGSIPAGVAAEISKAKTIGIWVLELPSGITRRSMSVSETREYLREVGKR